MKSFFFLILPLNKKLYLTATILFVCSLKTLCTAQPVFNKVQFQEMTATQRYRFVHDYPFWKVFDVNQLSTLLSQMVEVANVKRDYRTQIALDYYLALIGGKPNFRFPKGKKAGILESLQDMQKIAVQQDYEVETLIASCCLTSSLYLGQKLSNEQYYVDMQRSLEELQKLGFEKCRDYNIASILFDFSKSLWNLGDFDKAYQYLRIAEQYIEPTIEGGFYYTQVLSYLQTYWKNKKEYNKSMVYAQRILLFHQNFHSNIPEHKLWSEFWLNFASIDIASLLIDQGKIKEGEVYANKGFQLIKSRVSLDPIVSKQAEFDALMILIPVKLKLNKVDEVPSLLKLANNIKSELEPIGKLDYFKPLRLYKYSSEYYEKVGGYAEALHYTHLAQTLQDSLNQHNDVQKISQMQLRYEVEKYANHVKAIESEKQLQKYLRNAIILILLLVLGLVYVNHQRLRHKHHEKESELEASQNELAWQTQHFRNMSELIENLRQENEKLNASDNQHEHFEKLISSTILTDEGWTNFKRMFEKVHPGYMQSVKEKYPDLTNAELRLLMLEKLDLSTQEMANMIGVNKNTIHQTRLRLRKKTLDKS